MLPTLALPLLQTFAATASCGKPTFLFLVPWYQYLTLKVNPNTNNCTITDFDAQGSGVGAQDNVLGLHSPFLRIGLAVLDDLLRIAALVAVGYIIAGGITLITSQGSADGAKKGRETIINALIGLTTAIIAASIVSFIGNRLGAS